jgi:hypothetical protein
LLLTFDLSGMEALPIAMLLPTQRSGSFEARTSRLQEVRNAVIRVKVGVTQKRILKEWKTIC